MGNSFSDFLKFIYFCIFVCCNTPLRPAYVHASICDYFYAMPSRDPILFALWVTISRCRTRTLLTDGYIRLGGHIQNMVSGVCLKNTDGLPVYMLYLQQEQGERLGSLWPVKMSVKHLFPEWL